MHTVQVGHGEIFAVQADSRITKAFADPSDSNKPFINGSFIGRKRSGLSLCAGSQDHVYIIGGKDLINSQYFDSYQRYFPNTHNWVEQPQKMNIARAHHSSCFLAGSLYVFGGEVSADGTLTNSIEMLPLEPTPSDRW